MQRLRHDHCASFATGGWGPNELFVSSESGGLGDSIRNTHRGFETPCGSYAHMKLTRYLLSITGNSPYGDSMERVILNTVLGAKPLQSDGRAFYYSDYHPNAKKGFHPDRCPCCAGSLPQATCEYHAGAYFTDKRGLLVNLYGPSSVKSNQQGATFALTQSTKYPLSGLVRMRISAPTKRRFTLRSRIPQWVEPDMAWLNVNGKRVRRALRPGTFASLTACGRTATSSSFTCHCAFGWSPLTSTTAIWSLSFATAGLFTFRRNTAGGHTRPAARG